MLTKESNLSQKKFHWHKKAILVKASNQRAKPKGLTWLAMYTCMIGN